MQFCTTSTLPITEQLVICCSRCICLQEELLRHVRQSLEDALQLLSRVSCLGPIEAFFTADDLLSHYQRRLDATLELGKQLQQQRQQVRLAICTTAMAAFDAVLDRRLIMLWKVAVSIACMHAADCNSCF